ncbi:GntR family transcriptional regulator [Pseudactinotalea sp. HY158]|uniref:GntR family transcriptional regulator n=1 Tax=Pseudactinotalea sp. HY158 TaxID=2654547 RepID=UPI001E6592AC|nr:GntR family transcriptional regulator [Pseudactinotalea sp. HY158]
MMSIRQALATEDSVGAPRVLGEQVVERLRRLIITGELAAGAHLVETDISGAFGVSRGPVREALRRLVNEGLVGSRRGRMYVIGLSRDDIDELYHLRRLLELDVLQLAIARPQADFSAAHDALEVMARARDARDPVAYAAADLDFHTAFYQAAAHRRLTDIWLMYRPTFADILAITNSEDRDLGPSYHDHSQLLEAIDSHDSIRAVSILNAHLDGSHRRLIAAHGRHVHPPQ